MSHVASHLRAIRLRTISPFIISAAFLFLASVFLEQSADAAGFHLSRTKASRSASSHEKGYFDGSDYQLSLYFSPSFGYESNYRYVSEKAEGSLFWSTSGGAELRYRPSEKTYLRGEVSASVLMPLKNASLTGFLIEIPIIFTYRLTERWELFLSNHAALERDRSPPVFFDTDLSSLLTKGGKTIVYLTFYEQLRPAIAFKPIAGLTLDAGPYFRIKQVNFNQNPAGADPDYRLFDVGADFAASYRFINHLQVRAHYDFAFRFYNNVKARPPENTPALNQDLRALRHYVDLRLRGNYSYFGAFAGYGFRLNGDNGGSLEYLEHHLFGGVSFDYKNIFSLSGQVFAALRNYRSRTACEASTEDPTGGCKEADPTADSTPQNSHETLLGVRAEASFTITDWFSASIIWELEDSGAGHDVAIVGIAPSEDPQAANHRIMGGVSLSL
ncbi:MAG: hypothetical protein KAI47_00395 [Deltaproteobacteria bacterium]|nr:hypothetical protein [Deltaproteobacteria bacterium]